MKSRRRRFAASPRKLQMSKSYEKKLTGKRLDEARRQSAKARKAAQKAAQKAHKRRTNYTNTLKARRRLLSRRPPLPYEM